MSNTTIRQMVKSDIPAVIEMVHALNAFHDFEGAITAKFLERETETDAPWVFVTVAERAGVLIGYTVLIRIAKVADGLRGLDINHMYVVDTARGAGVGRMLIDDAKDLARRFGCSYLMISTAPDNLAGQAAYKACGFDDLATSRATRFRMGISA